MNLPNSLTLLRLGMLPFVLALIWPGLATPRTTFWAGQLYIVAGVLDVVDGHLARRMGLVTALGKFLDPLADKLFHLATLIALLQLPGPWVPPWVVMVVLCRELAITGLRGIAVSEGIVIAAGEGGKVKTAFGTAGMVALLIHYPYAIHLGFTHFVLDPSRVGVWLTYVSIAFSLTSFVGYVRGFQIARRLPV